MSNQAKGGVKPLIKHFEGLKDKDQGHYNKGSRRVLEDVSNTRRRDVKAKFQSRRRSSGRRRRSSAAVPGPVEELEGIKLRSRFIFKSTPETTLALTANNDLIPTPILSEPNAEPATASTLPDNNDTLPLLSILRLNKPAVRFTIDLDPSGSPLGILAQQLLNDKLGRSNIQFGDEYPWRQWEKVSITLLQPGDYGNQTSSVTAFIPEPRKLNQRRVVLRGTNDE